MAEAPTDHPGDDALRALSLGRLAAADLAHVSAHLGACPVCCERIDRLAADDHLTARLRHGRTDVLVGPAQRRSAVRALRRSHGVEPAAPMIGPAPAQIGDYDVLGEVGRGGMGVVYKVWHRGLHRPAALKMVLAGEFASPTQELRFRLEAELAARVRHPNIVQVYEIGSYGGRPFLALEWVEGGSLADRLDGTPWPPREAAALVETLARAIDVAHGEGVVHRDLKPANILMTADGVPRIADFGLALPTEGGAALTQSGLLVGTPGYMAPEQAAGKRAAVGPAADVYALGVVLYQLLTGRLPFQGDNTLEVLRAVAADEPPRPRRLQPRLPRDLEAVTLHCLEKEPGRRYASALALAEDLGRFRAGRQVTARPVGAAARLSRAARRRPLVASLAALLALTVTGGMGAVTWKWLEANGERDRANTAASQLDAEKQAALFQAYRASLAAASASVENHDVADAARHLDAAPAALRGWEWRHLHSRLDDSSAAAPLPAGPNSFLLAAPDRLRVGVVTEAGLRVTDLDGCRPRTVPISPDRRRHIDAAQTRRGLRVAAWADNASFDVLDDAGRVVCRVATPENKDVEPAAVVVSPDGGRLACRADGDWSRVAVFDATTGKRTADCAGHAAPIWTAAFSPDGSRLATGGEDRTARVWDAATGAPVAVCRGHASKVVSAAFSPDGTRLVTTSSDGTVRQWDPATGREAEPPYDRHAADVLAAVYSPDGQFVASAGEDRTVRLWKARGRQDAAVLHGHAARVVGVAFAADGRRLASLSRRSGLFGEGDNTVRVWDVDPAATLPALRGHGRAVYPVAYSPDGRRLASGSWDGTVRLWDGLTGELCATLPHPGPVLSLAFGPDGTWLVTGCQLDDRLRVWDVTTARVSREMQLADKDFQKLTLSPDGTRLATAAVGKADKPRLTVFDVAADKAVFSADGAALAYSPDGRWLAAAAADQKTVLLLDARTHEIAARFAGHENTVFAAAFSPDGRSVASCGKDRTVRLWHIETGECQVLRGHTDEVFAVAFHPDGTRLATAGREGSVWLWDVARGQEVARLPGHRSLVWSLAFSPGGATLASGSGDTTVRLWDTAPLTTRHQARREAAAERPAADRLVEDLWRKSNDPAAVAANLTADPTLSESLRREALRAVLRRARPAGAVPTTLPNP